MVEGESGDGGVKSRPESMKAEAAWMRPEEPPAAENTEKRAEFLETF